MCIHVCSVGSDDETVNLTGLEIIQETSLQLDLGRIIQLDQLLCMPVKNYFDQVN